MPGIVELEVDLIHMNTDHTLKEFNRDLDDVIPHKDIHIVFIFCSLILCHLNHCDGAKVSRGDFSGLSFDCGS